MVYDREKVRSYLILWISTKIMFLGCFGSFRSEILSVIGNPHVISLKLQIVWSGTKNLGKMAEQNPEDIDQSKSKVFSLPQTA